MDCQCLYICNPFGGLAQLARALAWHARGRRFDPDTLHKKNPTYLWDFFLLHIIQQVPINIIKVSTATDSFNITL